MIQSLAFWLTLLIAVIVFWQLPQKYRFGFLALVSFAYLVTLDAVAAIALVGWVLAFFYFAPHALAAKRYSALVVPGLVTAALGYLIYHKYLNDFASLLKFDMSPGGVAIPLGISYFTFKLIHYAIEVSRGNITDRSLSKFFCYIFLFPIFTAGPIERFDHFDANIEDIWQRQSAVEGLTRIIHGLIKMFVLAQLVQPEVIGMGIPPTSGHLVRELNEISPLYVWAFLALTYLYAYLDFSAYSDIAIGASRLFGLRIMENFNFPIFARDISDFWRRWHMTLANWCQSYVYIPVIGRTRSPYAAAYGTFLAMGLWHGATPTWIMWGLYHATGVSIFLTWTRIKRKRKWGRGNHWITRYLGIPMTFAFVTGSYAFSSTGGSGWISIRIFAKLFGVTLGA